MGNQAGINQLAQKNYVAGLKSYHKKLETFVHDNFDIITTYLEVLSWGYHTTAIYLKSTDGKEYLLKLADWSKEKELGVLKDLELSKTLGAIIPTPNYLPTLSGTYLLRFEDKILRLSDYISGLSPLDMNYDILGQMVEVLHKIHAFTTLPQGQVLLHGDLTPHNILVSFDKLVAVMDFELSVNGPREWDLARTAVFSWNYMPNTPFDQVAKFILEKYAFNSLTVDLFYQYAVENAQNHLASVEKHRAEYNRQEDWKKDYNFAKQQVEIILKICA